MLSQYAWTKHAQYKMKFYGLSESRVRRVIKSPLRIEEGIAPQTIAAMQPASYKTKDGQKTWSQEIWVMYRIKNKSKHSLKQTSNLLKPKENVLTIISAWRYPGKTKVREGLPPEILQEIAEALYVV